MQDIIGTTAGQIWEYLKENGATTSLKIRAALGISNSLLYLAAGWLSREDKIEIKESVHTYIISLKE